LDSIAHWLYQVSDASGAFDIADGVTRLEYTTLMHALRDIYGTSLATWQQGLHSAEGDMLARLPEPFYSHLVAGSGVNISALAPLTMELEKLGGCYHPGDHLSEASESGFGSGSASGSSDGVQRPAPDGYKGFGLRRRLLALGARQSVPQQADVHTRDAKTDNTFESHTTWTQYCAGTLIHPNWVLTAAGCVADEDLRRVVNTHAAVLGGHECSKHGGVETRAECAAGVTRARLARVVVHPLYKVDKRYDVALLELQEAAEGFEPAPLDDGTDLGFLSCKLPKLTAVGWWPADADKVPLRRQDLEYVNVSTCAKQHLDVNGYQTVDEHHLSICARPLPDWSSGSGVGGGSGCQANGYFGQDGGALLVPREGTTDGFVLAGVIRSGLGAAASAGDPTASACPPDSVPRAHVRVEGVRQWILSVSALGAAVPKRLTLHLDSLRLPAHSQAALRIYAGADDDKLLEEVDYACAAGEVDRDASSAILLELSGLNSGVGIPSNTPCGERVGLEEEWGRDCRREHVRVRIATRGCQENAAVLASRSRSSQLSLCDDPLASGIEGCLVSFPALSRAC